MSAFVVADSTINRVVEWLSWEVVHSHWLRAQVEKQLHIDIDAPDWEKLLGRAMFQLNIGGVEDRYGKGAAKGFRALDYRYVPEHGTKIQVLKSLRCWIYQCTEGDVAREPLLQFFDTVVVRYLLMSIVRDLPEYQEAAWE